MQRTEYITTAQRKHKFLEAFKETGMIMYACRKAGVSRSFYYRWWKKNDDFSEKLWQSFEELYKDPAKKAVLDELPEHKRNIMHYGAVEGWV